MDRSADWIVLVLAVLVLVAGCADGEPSGGDSPTHSPTPTVSETPVSTATPTAAGTDSPTATPSPTPSPTATPPRAERTEFRMTVVRVIDGDTMEVRFATGETDTIRLLGVDTPEVYTVTDPTEWEGIPDTEAGRDHLDTWGDKASAFAKQRLENGEEVRIVIDEQADRRGSYGRLLVYLYDDGELFNLVLIEESYAQLYEAPFSKRSEFAAAEATAQDTDVGVWDFTASTTTPTATPTPTETPSGGGGALEVVGIHADAAGNDHENLNDEYIVFENTDDDPLDLSGWIVEDEADHTYRFPDGFTLGPGARVTLYTGSGTDTEMELYWGSGSAIWNNGGDTIYVYDDVGATVIERTYS